MLIETIQLVLLGAIVLCCAIALLAYVQSRPVQSKSPLPVEIPIARPRPYWVQRAVRMYLLLFGGY